MNYCKDAEEDADNGKCNDELDDDVKLDYVVIG